MASNVMAWRIAICNGFEPGLYSYDDIPLGEYDAILDCKIWAKKVMAINCYFTQVETGRKFQLTVFCKNRTGKYQIKEGNVDFVQCDISRMYHVTVYLNEKGLVIFKCALLVENRT